MSMVRGESFVLMTKQEILHWARKVRGYRIANTSGLTKDEIVRQVLALEAKRTVA